MQRCPRRRLLLTVLCAGFLALAGAAQAAPVVVTLGFDDGLSDQWTARDMLDAHGMHGVFYVNSSRPGKARFLGYAQLRQLQAEGHEIGGHTIDHVNLPTLGDDDQRREICDDRADLLAHGLAVTDFAYPFGAHDPSSEQVVQLCGYDSARITSGVAWRDGCVGCPKAETFPPRDRFATRTPDSVKAVTSLQDLEAYVTAAQTTGGGWVQIVIHHVCDGCNRDAVAPATLNAFLDFLAAQPADALRVQTVREALGGGAPAPAVHGPALPRDGANLLHDPSLETPGPDAGSAQCWTQGGAGVAQADWTRTTDAFSGVAAAGVQISSLGPKADRKLVSRQDTGTCAPRPAAGHRYRFAWRYRSSAAVRPVAYLRGDDGSWRFWAQGPPASAAPSGWAQALWTTPRVPAGSIGISVGVSLRSVASMTLDDLLLQDGRTPLPAPAHEFADAGDAPSAHTASLHVAAGRLPVLVYGAPPADLLGAQRTVARHLALLRRAGFHPVGAAALRRVLAGGSAGVSRPVVVAFRGSAVDSVGLADGVLGRDGARAVLLAPAATVLSATSLRTLAPASRWDLVAPGSAAGRAVRGRLALHGRALRVPLTFQTPDNDVLRALRGAAGTRRTHR